MLKARTEKLLAGGAFGMRFAFPVLKADAATREIEGIATSDRIDSQGEILEYSASKEAFAAFQGNIREMHAEKAVGRATAVEFDDANRQVVVRAFISKGAQDTMEKILDGTLSMFSVGGTRLRSELRPDGVRHTTKYSLNELSLVDVGANPSCKIALVKMERGVPVETEVLGSPPRADGLAESLAVLDAAYYATAAAIRKHGEAGLVQTSGEYLDLTRDLFKLAALRRMARGAAVRKIAVSLPLGELAEIQARLEFELRKWNEARLPQNCKEYERLTREFVKVCGMVKAAGRRALR